MGRNRIAEFLTIVMLCVTGCAKPGLEAARKKLIYNQTQRSPRATLLDPESPQILPSTHFAAGRMFEAQGHFAQAIEQYAKTIAVNHSHVAAHHRLGLIYSKLGQHDDAIQMFRKAVELKPDNAVLHNNLGFELMFTKDWSGAIGQFDKAIALEPAFARAHINLGMTLSKTGRFDEALAHFRAVLPESDAQYNLGLMYRSAQRYDDATRSFKLVLAADPKFQAAQTQLADIATHLTPAVDATTEVPVVADNARAGLDQQNDIKTGEREPTSPIVRPEPMMMPPSTNEAVVDDVPSRGRDEVRSGSAGLTEDGWLTDSLFGGAVENASVAEPFDLLLLRKPYRVEEFIAPEAVSGRVVPTEGAVVPIPAAEVAAPTGASADAYPLDAIPYGRLNDEVARIDDEIRCLIDEALETMAVATPELNASNAVHLDPVLVEPTGDSTIGDFVADTTDPIEYSTFPDRSTNVIEPTTAAFVPHFPEDQHGSPVVVDAPSFEVTETAPERLMPGRDAKPVPWRARLNGLSADLIALRDEIHCLEATDMNAAEAQQPATTAAFKMKVVPKPKIEKIAQTAPNRMTARKSGRSGSPEMMLAYKPTAAPSILAAPSVHSKAPRSTPIVRGLHEQPPTALARPVQASDAFSSAEIGPALPAPPIGSGRTDPERVEFDWDARFGDLHDLLSITENEIRCWDGIDEAQDEEQVTDDAEPQLRRHRTRVTPVRFRPRHNPFYEK